MYVIFRINYGLKLKSLTNFLFGKKLLKYTADTSSQKSDSLPGVIESQKVIPDIMLNFNVL